MIVIDKVNDLYMATYNILLPINNNVVIANFANCTA